MPATQSDLDIELEHLRLDVGNLNVLRKMTRAQERRVMGDVFVWWQRAREVVGYLEQCYSVNDIVFNKTQGEVNFRPLLRLVTQNQISENDLFGVVFIPVCGFFHTDRRASPMPCGSALQLPTWLTHRLPLL